MASSRDDFIIAIRSAFLKKETQQKFSLVSLLAVSILIIVLSSFNIKIINSIRGFINEVVYRSSFIVSAPEILSLTHIIKLLNTQVFMMNSS